MRIAIAASDKHENALVTPKQMQFIHSFILCHQRAIYNNPGDAMSTDTHTHTLKDRHTTTRKLDSHSMVAKNEKELLISLTQ